ncbi:alpha/beta hydrolase [Polycladidibacter hongkongensis]|uniref:alpha/beta hydrolase n=1 Tax=Polycladidibacter hongkongensis TaxID=1647556 RepID=UPI0008302475|nr:alpha/beta fold hydrolase [Pseudovibrio hongkongensis]
MLKAFVGVFIAFVLAGAALFLFEPDSAPIPPTQMPEIQIGEDADAYLNAREAAVPAIRQGLQKQIIWADPTQKDKTRYAVVYLHGFSASKEEARPFPDIIAKQLGANLFYTRFKGHGRTGAAMATASAEDWMNDTLESIKIANHIGNETIIIASSTGGTLASWLALQQQIPTNNIKALILLSPNYAINAAGASLLSKPLIRSALPIILGENRSSSENPSKEEEHAWTITYPLRSTFPMAELVAYSRDLPVQDAKIPALFIYSKADKTVDADATDQVYNAWGGSKQRILITNSEHKNSHLNVGKLTAPKATKPIAAQTLDWLSTIGIE